MNTLSRWLFSRAPALLGTGLKQGESGFLGPVEPILDHLQTSYRDRRAREASYSTERGEGRASPTEEPIEHVRARIFGHHLGDGLRSGRKILSRPLIGAKVASYYPVDYFAGDPLLLDLEAERCVSPASVVTA
jgi:hypothetical protein